MTRAAVKLGDRPEFTTEWTTRRQKDSFSYKDKFLESIKKICQDNLLAVQKSSQVLTELRKTVQK